MDKCILDSGGMWAREDLPMISIHVKLSETDWRKLRDMAEEQRTNGRASVSGVILGAVRDLLGQHTSRAPREASPRLATPSG